MIERFRQYSNVRETAGKLLFGVLTVIQFISYLTAILNYFLEDDSVYNEHCMLSCCATTFYFQVEKQFKFNLFMYQTIEGLVKYTNCCSMQVELYYCYILFKLGYDYRN